MCVCVCACACVCVFGTLGMTALIDKILTSSLPSYDLSTNVDLVFNFTDVGEDESKFMISRLKKAKYMKDQQKIGTVSLYRV